MSHPLHLTRRDALGALAAGALLGRTRTARAVDARPWEIYTFAADVTPLIGHPCMGGGIPPVKSIADPLEARGFVLQGGTLEKPVALVSVDWCEIRNDAYDRWREAIAKAAGTSPHNVLLTAIHQHDTPIADLTAERILEENQCVGRICNLDFHELIVKRVARAVEKARKKPRRVTRVGMGEAKADRLASNRRYELPDGSIAYNRMSASTLPEAKEAGEGLIDPMVKALSFWNGDVPLVAMYHYAIHPMSHYGKGECSADFVGLARRGRQKTLPDVFQLYASGCSGNLVAGKYNDGSPADRPALAARLEDAMTRAWEATRAEPLERASLVVEPMTFEPRGGDGFTEEDLRKRLLDHDHPFQQCLAAMALSWRKRLAEGRPVDLPMLDLGPAAIVLLPGETYVEYQLLAQKLRPDKFVVALGYGDAATGYIPTSLQVAENDGNLHDWNWVAPSAEKVLTEAIEKVMKIKK